MQRRNFIKVVSQASLLASLPILQHCATSNVGGNKRPYGVQLWTFRDIINEDPRGVIQKVAQMGFDYVETFDYTKGLYFGLTPVEFKKLLDDNGLKIHSAHVNFKENFEQKVHELANMGVKYAIAPWLGPQKSIKDFYNYAADFNKYGAICAKHGMQFAYHNHDYSFKALDGEIPMDVFLKQCDSNNVVYEMDLYWVVTAGLNPLDYLKKYPNRFQLCHVKDRQKGVAADVAFASCPLGQGQIDYAKMLPETEKYGMKYFIYEQEAYTPNGVLADAKVSIDYLKKLTF